MRIPAFEHHILATVTHEVAHEVAMCRTLSHDVVAALEGTHAGKIINTALHNKPCQITLLVLETVGSIAAYSADIEPLGAALKVAAGCEAGIIFNAPAFCKTRYPHHRGFYPLANANGPR